MTNTTYTSWVNHQSCPAAPSACNNLLMPSTNHPSPPSHQHSLPHTAPQHTTNTITSHQLLNRRRMGNGAPEDWLPSASPPHSATRPGHPALPPLNYKQCCNQQILTSSTETGGHQHMWQAVYMNYWYIMWTNCGWDETKLGIIQMENQWMITSVNSIPHSTMSSCQKIPYTCITNTQLPESQQDLGQ